MHRVFWLRCRALLVAVVSCAALAGLTVSPASAGLSGLGPDSACYGWETAVDQYTATALLASNSAARPLSPTAREKAQLVADTEISAGSAPDTTATFSTVVDVYFHVVYAGRSPRQGWVSMSQIEQQIAVLNQTFTGSGFSFRLAGYDYTLSTDWYAQSTFQAEVEMKTALHQGDSTDLNIYSTSGGGYLGWAYYPKTVQTQKYAILDGVVLHSGTLPGGYVKNYSLGYTATHEVGHWLGLAHTFDGGCTGRGDYVDDTPAQATPTSGCPVDGTQDSCPTEAGFDPIHNFMDYSYDVCYYEFTVGQAVRMQEQWLHWRA